MQSMSPTAGTSRQAVSINHIAGNIHSKTKNKTTRSNLLVVNHRPIHCTWKKTHLSLSKENKMFIGNRDSHKKY